MTKSVDIISSILDCLPDKSQNASRLLFTSMVKIAKECPKETFQYVLDNMENFSSEKHEGMTHTLCLNNNIYFSRIRVVHGTISK